MCLLLALGTIAQAAPPVVSNIRASQRPGTKLVDVYYDLPDANGAGHPAHSMTWYDMVKWCNARSQKEGLTPCYYEDAVQTVIYKSGNVNVENTMVKWTANGYRLPTEAEWEKVARGGGNDFPAFQFYTALTDR